MKSKLQTIGLSIFALLIFGGLISGGANSPDPRASLYQSATYYDYIQKDFVTYVEKSRDWLKDNRTFITADDEKELNMNAPYVLYPEQKGEKAVLLVHGLGDSPYTFSDVSKTLVKQGFVVQVLLLPGHGSKPEDLMLPTYQDWQHIVDHYAGLLKSRYENVWLGGFSTGANLVTIHALDKGNVEALLLFSPGFQSQADSPGIPIMQAWKTL